MAKKRPYRDRITERIEQRRAAGATPDEIVHYVVTARQHIPLDELPLTADERAAWDRYFPNPDTQEAREARCAWVAQRTKVPPRVERQASEGRRRAPLTPLEQTTIEVVAVYRGSNASRTKGLYARLRGASDDGKLAVELLRASKASERAKTYRGGVRGVGSYRSISYDRKQAAIDGLCRLLAGSACSWGWGIDNKQPAHRHVLYVDLPTGQVSFHSGERGEGPDYGNPWDGIPGESANRICRWAAQLITPAVAAGIGQAGSHGADRETAPA